LNNICSSTGINCQPPIVSAPEKEPLPQRDIIKLVTRYADHYSEINNAKPTHLFVHPSLFKQIAINFHKQQYIAMYGMVGLHGNYIFKCGIYELTIKFVDISENDDFVLVGNESTYNDYVMEREIIGDHS